MSHYTYRLNPEKKSEPKQVYKRSQLEKMTTWQLREICQNDRLVVPAMHTLDHEGFVRLILRFRGHKEYRHIETYYEGGMERLQDVLFKVPLQIIPDKQIDIPASLVIYNDMAMDEFDGYQIQVDPADGIPLYEGNLLLVDEELQLYSCFYVKAHAGKYLLCKGKTVELRYPEKHRYAFLYFPSEQSSEYLFEQYMGLKSAYPGTLRAVRIPLLEFRVKTTERSQLPLMIDFGSSNTTMGVCLPDGSRKIAAWQGGQVIPSVIGISGTDQNGLSYVFGHEATALNKDNYQDQDVPVFYDIKRWISDPERKERVILVDGIKAEVVRKEMLQAFFNYLLEAARKQFKCEFTGIQLLAPVRQKEKFQALFCNLISGIDIDCSLDEGMAVLFSNVDKLIERSQYKLNHWYHALIIDCGGGTTDLTSGRFRIQSNRVSYTIDMETSYEAGDTNFGGNNLTYRILQLIKVKLSQELKANQFPGQKLKHNQEPAEPESGVEPEYEYPEDWEKQYQEAEAVLPTCFKDYEEKSRAAYFYVKNNYYYLFELAEQVKKMFLQNNARYELWIGTEKDSQLFLDKWKFSIRQDDQLRRMDKPLSVRLYRIEIEELLRPDIYQLTDRFLKTKFINHELEQYDLIKLTGQSCRSRLFEEALKEYIPGVMIQRERFKTKGSELKMCCLEGAMSYFWGHKLGYMNVSTKNQVGTLPYEIMVYTHENKPQVLVHGTDGEGHIGYISRFMFGLQLDIHLMDLSGQHLKTCCYECGFNRFHPTTQEDIDRKYAGSVIQDETDNILEGEMKFFIWADRQRWGFIVFPVRRDQDQLYQGEETFFDFEDDTWENNFFDGRK